MKKLMVGILVSGALCIPTLAMASHETPPNPGPFANRGECESALKQRRNEIRKNDNHGFTPSEINEQARTQSKCEETNGEWFIVPA